MIAGMNDDSSRPAAQRATQNGVLAVVTWVLLIVTCGLAVIPLLGFLAYVIGVPLLLVALILSIVIIAQGGTTHGVILLVCTLLAPFFVFFAPMVTTQLVARLLAESQKERMEEFLKSHPVNTQGIPAKSGPSLDDLPWATSTPHASVEEVTMLETVTVPLLVDGAEAGSMSIPQGIKVELVSHEGETLTVRHGKGVAVVPATATDYKPAKKE